jgi:hypothetical protein
MLVEGAIRRISQEASKPSMPCGRLASKITMSGFRAATLSITFLPLSAWPHTSRELHWGKRQNKHFSVAIYCHPRQEVLSFVHEKPSKCATHSIGREHSKVLLAAPSQSNFGLMRVFV